MNIDKNKYPLTHNLFLNAYEKQSKMTTSQNYNHPENGDTPTKVMLIISIIALIILIIVNIFRS